MVTKLTFFLSNNDRHSLTYNLSLSFPYVLRSSRSGICLSRETIEYCAGSFYLCKLVLRGAAPIQSYSCCRYVSCLAEWSAVWLTVVGVLLRLPLFNSPLVAPLCTWPHNMTPLGLINVFGIIDYLYLNDSFPHVHDFCTLTQLPLPRSSGDFMPVFWGMNNYQTHDDASLGSSLTEHLFRTF